MRPRSEPDPELDDAARRRDLPAVVEAVGERLAMPTEPSGPLAACARALVDRHLADAETAPAVARVVAEELLRVARTCKECAQIHPPRYGTRKGEEKNITWTDPGDGHLYVPVAYPAIYYLDKILQEGT